MSSMRTLNRRLAVWDRYARKTCWNPRHKRPAGKSENAVIPDGHRRAWNAREHERERRQCFRFYPVYACFDCGLADPYDGAGDGIGSCDCPRCEQCGAGPGCDCRDDDEFFCGEPGCSCGDGPDDDAGHGDNWIVMPHVETVTAFSEARLL